MAVQDRRVRAVESSSQVGVHHRLPWNRNHPLSLSMTNYLHLLRRDPRVEKYQPDAPGIDVGQLTIHSIKPEGKDGIEALLFTDSSSPIWYRISVFPKVYEDKKSVASIFRQATTTKDTGILPPSQMTVLGVASPSPTTREVLCSIADTMSMGISKRYDVAHDIGASFTFSNSAHV